MLAESGRPEFGGLQDAAIEPEAGSPKGAARCLASVIVPSCLHPEVHGTTYARPTRQVACAG